MAGICAGQCDRCDTLAHLSWKSGRFTAKPEGNCRCNPDPPHVSRTKRRIYISPTPQFDDKLAGYMERNGIRSKAAAIRSILHAVAVGREVKL